MTGILNSEYVTIKTLNVGHKNTFFCKFISSSISDNISSDYNDDYDDDNNNNDNSSMIWIGLTENSMSK